MTSRNKAEKEPLTDDVSITASKDRKALEKRKYLSSKELQFMNTSDEPRTIEMFNIPDAGQSKSIQLKEFETNSQLANETQPTEESGKEMAATDKMSSPSKDEKGSINSDNFDSEVGRFESPDTLIAEEDRARRKKEMQEFSFFASMTPTENEGNPTVTLTPTEGSLTVDGSSCDKRSIEVSSSKKRNRRTANNF